ncbi:hypothetical protein XENTR_v10016018 [Xenopus tropicalis]|uniref:HEPACAM family member 2 isoform X1 n=1 Tax=Xenopus tropicalis TaxID=8364 RepID=A0A8J0QQ22_XENTR|nr:HEPACAM family member 2 isoform X1 [Xenopus tropicalis]KAE8596231.1 hypothetical protein XENTR_v10016018 [Xenopus tropicalis]
MGQDASMELLSGTSYLLNITLYALLLGTCSALKIRIPSPTIHGIEGRPLVLPVHYDSYVSASEIQIIWLFERHQTPAMFLLSSINHSVVSDLEFQHKFTLQPPNASLLIYSLHLRDEGNYTVKVNIKGNTTISYTQKIDVIVHVPVSKPTISIQPPHEVVEYIGNITFHCAVEKGTRVTYVWLRDGKPLESSPSYNFYQNGTFLIDSVMKTDIGNYTCLAKNYVSQMESDVITPTIYYGPYGLTVSSDKGLKVGEVFTVDIGESIQFDCSADSNPPNTFSWIQRTQNSTEIINYGPYFKILSDKVGQKTVDYMCRAYNNITGKRDETQFTVIYASTDPQKLEQNGNTYPLAAITGISLFIILSMCLLFVWKKYHYRLFRARPWKIQHNRPSQEYRRTQIFSGHEDAMNDFGIYEFVTLPDPYVPHRVPSSKSVSVSNASHAQDTSCTVYEVIQHVPEQQHDNREE